MIKVEENVSLRPFNTFGIDANAKYLCRIKSVAEFQELLNLERYKAPPPFILGGGSNILFTEDVNGLVIKVELKGIEIVSETEETVQVKVYAGENWHQFVLHAIGHNWGGVENLSLIPGTVGAAPMQNIGAYGVEIKNLIEKVEAIELSTGVLREFTHEECGFGYRESVFKKGLAKKYFISSVTLRLTKKNHHINTSYGAIIDTLALMNADHVTIRTVSDAVIQIRKKKLPDPVLIGNAGSFFKNPTLDINQFQALQTKWPTVPSYPIDNQNVKIPAGWLIEQCGWKGKKINDVGVHPQQALVLVNYGKGSGKEILSLSEKIQQSVIEKFKITLTPEVNIL